MISARIPGVAANVISSIHASKDLRSRDAPVPGSPFVWAVPMAFGIFSLFVLAVFVYQTRMRERTRKVGEEQKHAAMRPTLTLRSSTLGDTYNAEPVRSLMDLDDQAGVNGDPEQPSVDLLAGEGSPRARVGNDQMEGVPLASGGESERLPANDVSNISRRLDRLRSLPSLSSSMRAQHPPSAFPSSLQTSAASTRQSDEGSLGEVTLVPNHPSDEPMLSQGMRPLPVPPSQPPRAHIPRSDGGTFDFHQLFENRDFVDQLLRFIGRTPRTESRAGSELSDLPPSYPHSEVSRATSR